jgi:serine/threonine protein kinase
MGYGLVIAARYRIIDLLGAGGMAEVVLAEDLRLGRLVAVKRSHAGALPNAMLAREGRILARLDHPGVVRVEDAFEVDGRHHLVLELVTGVDLARVHERRPPLPRLIAGIARALAYVHDRGAIHLDIKAENVMVDARGEPRLVDFGIAACAGEPSPIADNVLLGTPRAMAPEQIAGHAVDRRADLFSFGALLYELCTGQAPFSADSATATIQRVLDHAPAPVNASAPALPRRIADLIDHMLEKDPALRPQSADEIVARC